MHRYRFVLFRPLQFIPVLIGISIITFILVRLIPGDPARMLLGSRATPTAIANIRAQYGLDEPMWVQYLYFVKNLFNGEMGRSLVFKVDVLPLIATRIEPTLVLVAGSVLLSLIIAVPLATIASRNRGTGYDHGIRAVSTVGLARRIRDLADDQAEGRAPAFGLAVSLHAPTDAQRSAIMPVNRSEKTDLTALKDAVRHYHARTGRPVTYEYCMFAGANDQDADARALARVAAWAPSKVNLIMYNPVAGTGFGPSGEARLDAFISVLVSKGVRVTVRRSRGQDIDAACGQLAVAANPPASPVAGG